MHFITLGLVSSSSGETVISSGGQPLTYATVLGGPVVLFIVLQFAVRAGGNSPRQRTSFLCCVCAVSCAPARLFIEGVVVVVYDVFRVFILCDSGDGTFRSGLRAVVAGDSVLVSGWEGSLFEFCFAHRGVRFVSQLLL